MSGVDITIDVKKVGHLIGPLRETWRIDFQRLRIVKAQESSGDEPYFATIGFRSRLMTRGSTRVAWSRIIDGSWAENSKSSTERSIPPRQGCVRFPDVVRVRTLADGLPEIIGVVFVSLEQDATPSGDMKMLLDRVAAQLETEVAALVENITVGADPEELKKKVAESVARVSAAVIPSVSEKVGIFLSSWGDVDDLTGLSVHVYAAVGEGIGGTGFPRLADGSLIERHRQDSQDYLIEGYVSREGRAGWESLDRTTTSAPSVCSWGAGRLDVFSRGKDGALQHRAKDGAQWHRWENLGERLASEPAAASWGPGRIDIVALGEDRSVRHLWFENQWQPWESLGGATGNAPALCSWGPGRLDVFIRTDAGTLGQEYFDGGWSGWGELDSTQIYDPTAASTRFGRIDLVARTLQGTLVHKWFDSGWSAWTPIDHTATQFALFAAGPSDLRLLLLDSDENLSIASFDGRTWTGSQRLGSGLYWGAAGTRCGRDLHVVSGTVANDLVHATARSRFGLGPTQWDTLRAGAVTVDRA